MKRTVMAAQRQTKQTRSKTNTIDPMVLEPVNCIGFEWKTSAIPLVLMVSVNPGEGR